MSQSTPSLRDGHQLRLLEGAGQLFPAMIKAMDAAQREIRLETYILDFSGSAAQVGEALERAARRGVVTQIVVDGLGTGELSDPWAGRLRAAGVQWNVYSPSGALGLLIPGRWRRMHRKLCVVDGCVAFCGGINVLDDFYDPNHGALQAPRLDFAVQVEGPLVQEVRVTMERLWLRMLAAQLLRQQHPIKALRALESTEDDGHGLPPVAEIQAAAQARCDATVGPASRAALVLRDNLRHRTRIERAYRKAISQAHEEIIIANAYFVPGGKMRRALILAARRGVRVRLLLQGRYEYFMQYYAARHVYGALLAEGVEIFEYSPSFLHAKVAVIDGHWATVGSSNLDPLSLLLAREANIVIEDPAFAQSLRDRLLRAMDEEGLRMDAMAYAGRSWRERCMERLARLLMRLALLIHRKEY
ncbi:MAG: cardiolipin synthase ClsB [Burkholderiaceae bacterium]|nr:cardiolipin synthase ClsB [Burkholderiaceae bacterium]MDO9088874.1 cardiolipin synthase ClsB [Burkholderiaceae bacterium]